MTIPAELTLTAYNNSPFLHVFKFNYAITDKVYKSQIRDISGNLITDFAITVNTTDNMITLLVDNMIMKTIKPNEYRFDLLENGIVKLKGKFVVNKGVTTI